MTAFTRAATMAVLLVASSALAAGQTRGVPSAQTPAPSAADLEAADVLVLVANGGSIWAMAERALVERLGTRRGVVFSFAVFGKAVEDPLAHFQMGHTSETELAVEAGLPAAELGRYKPLLDLAVARSWPIVPSVDGSVSPEIRKMGRKPDATDLPLVVYVTRPGSDPALFIKMVRQQLPGARVVSWTPNIVIDR